MIFQICLEGMFGYELYSNFTQSTKPNMRFLDCIFRWLGFLFIHSAFLLKFAVIFGFSVHVTCIRRPIASALGDYATVLPIFPKRIYLLLITVNIVG